MTNKKDIIKIHSLFFVKINVFLFVTMKSSFYSGFCLWIFHHNKFYRRETEHILSQPFKAWKVIIFYFDLPLILFIVYFQCHWAYENNYWNHIIKPFMFLLKLILKLIKFVSLHFYTVYWDLLWTHKFSYKELFNTTKNADFH